MKTFDPASLAHIEKRKGGRYWYFIRKSTGQSVRMPDPSDEWTFKRVHEQLSKGRHVKPAKLSFDKLIALYMASRDWADLAVGSRKQYERHLRALSASIGGYPVPRFRPHMGADMLHAMQDRPKVANARFDVLSSLLRYAVNIGWIDRHPLREIRRLRTEQKHAAPWPREAQEAFAAEAAGSTRLFFELALATGQRGGDVLRFRWSDIEGQVIHFTQQKTGKEMWIPLTPRLSAILAQTKPTGIFIVDDRGPVTYNAMEKRFKLILKRVGFEGLTIHGLRATLATEMAEAGYTDQEIMAWTGHTSEASLRSYTGNTRQRARALLSAGPKGERPNNTEKVAKLRTTNATETKD